MTNEQKREGLAALVAAINSMDEAKQQFLLGYIAGVSACAGTGKQAG